MKNKALLSQQIVTAMRAAAPSIAHKDLVAAALATLTVPRIRAALELHDLKEMAHAQEATAD